MNVLSIQTDVAYVMKQLTLARSQNQIAGISSKLIVDDCLQRAMDGMERIDGELKEEEKRRQTAANFAASFDCDED